MNKWDSLFQGTTKSVWVLRFEFQVGAPFIFIAFGLTLNYFTDFNGSFILTWVNVGRRGEAGSCTAPLVGTPSGSPAPGHRSTCTAQGQGVSLPFYCNLAPDST